MMGQGRRHWGWLGSFSPLVAHHHLWFLTPRPLSSRSTLTSSRLTSPPLSHSCRWHTVPHSTPQYCGLPASAPVEIRVDGEKCPYGRWRICVLSA